MQRYLIRRVLFMGFSLLVATLVVFGLSRATGDLLLLYAKPGGYGMGPEQVKAVSAKLGLDKPLVVQYFLWLGRALRGDLGNTIVDERPVVDVIGERIFNTIQLGIGAWLYAVLVGVPLGVLSAVRRGSLFDYVGRFYALLGMASPPFWNGIMAILVFAVTLNLLPSGTRGMDAAFPLSWANIKHFILPALILGWFPAASFMRLTRSAMLEVLDSEFIRFARAKGVRPVSVIWKHALRNALIPPLTMMAISMAGFITGSVVVETVFSWPGMGRLAVQAIQNQDFPTLTGCVLVFSTVFVLANFVADVAYAYVDPRIRYS